MALALLVLVMTRPVSFGTVLGVSAGLLVFAILVELLRRPGPVEMEQTRTDSPDDAVQDEGEADGAAAASSAAPAL
ncbi:hypothetical protein [Microbacterium sp. Se63.02b]|uniref:hypothetical protein n=3 Tax=unclassified Microbacterium TaxID=2609290 RepID=UPI001FCF2789|nr:hypothetical protein [Microbacterium sp. Se63.02b]